MKLDLNSLVRTNIKNLKPYSSARDEFTAAHRKMIFLDANENPFGDILNRYPDPQQRFLKEKLAAFKKINPQNILLGNGSDEVLDLLFRSFCEPNKDNVITLPPTYGMYGVLAQLNAIEDRKILLNVDFQPNVNQILDAQDENSKLLFLCCPNNPTGNLFEKDRVTKLIKNFNGLVVIDEAYIDFSDTESWIAKLSEYPNLIVAQTFSKAFGLAGIRLGICYASEAIISILNKVKPPYNVNQLTQQEAINFLEIKNSHYDHKELILKEKERLFEAMNELNFIHKIYPSDSNFFLIKVDDAQKRYNQLIAKGIVVRNRMHEPLCANSLRITIGTPKENWKLISALKTIENE